MSHANNGASDLNAWVGLFRKFCFMMGMETDLDSLFQKLYSHSLMGDADCGGLLSYGYYSGENITFINEGRPLFVRAPDSKFNLGNFMRAHLYSSLGAVKLGMDILLKDEGVPLDRIMGHGGLFKTPGVMQRYLAAAVNTPVTVMATASAAVYLADGKRDGKLEDYLEKRVFAGLTSEAVAPVLILIPDRKCQKISKTNLRQTRRRPLRGLSPGQGRQRSMAQIWPERFGNFYQGLV